MAATAQELINRAFRLTGILADGETLQASQSEDARIVLNYILESWSIEKLMTFQKTEGSHTLVATTASYTIGSGATIDTTRPTRIISAFIRDSSNVDYSLRVVNKGEFDRIFQKTNKSDIPSTLFYNPGYPNGTITLYPTPNTANTLHFTSELQFTAFSTLATSASLPPGYEYALIYALAIRLSYEYGAPVEQAVKDEAGRLKALLEDVNNDYERTPTIFDDVFSDGLDEDFYWSTIS